MNFWISVPVSEKKLKVNEAGVASGVHQGCGQIQDKVDLVAEGPSSRNLRRATTTQPKAIGDFV